MRRRNRKRIEITPKYFLLALTIVCVVLMIASLFFDSIMPSVRLIVSRGKVAYYTLLALYTTYFSLYRTTYFISIIRYTLLT